MKTYTAKRHHEETDWNWVLSNWDDIQDSSKEHYKQESETKEHYKQESESWVTCACGNLCASIPRDEDGGPTDNRLHKLGMNFSRALRDEKIKKARRILNKIEKRSTKILKKL